MPKELKGRCPLCGGELLPSRHRYVCQELECGASFTKRKATLASTVAVLVTRRLETLESGEALTTRQLVDWVWDNHLEVVLPLMGRGTRTAATAYQRKSISNAIKTAWKHGIGNIGRVPPRKPSWATTDHPDAVAYEPPTTGEPDEDGG